MPENQDFHSEIEKQIAAKLNANPEQKQEGNDTAKVDENIELKANDKKNENLEEGKKDGGEENKQPEEENIDTTIKLSAKAEEKKEDDKKEDEDEIAEEKLLAILSKKAGKEIKSLDEVLNPKKELSQEDKDKAKEERDNKKIAHALSQGWVTEKKLSKYFADIKNKTDLVFEQYWQDASAEDKELTKDAARKEFNERFGLDSEEESRPYRRGMKEINSLADQIIRNEYPEVFELESKYSSYENTLTSKQKREQDIIQKAPQYKKDLESAFDEIKSIKVSREHPVSKQQEDFTIDIDTSLLAPFKEKMLASDYAENEIINGWDKESIKRTVQAGIVLENLESIVFSAVDKALLKREMGLKGVKPTKDFTARGEQNFGDVKKKAEEELKQRLTGTPAATAAAN